MKKEKKKLYTKVEDLRFRKTPNTSNLKNLIRELKQGQEMEIIDGPWIKVRIGRTEGWVHGDYVTDEAPLVQIKPQKTDSILFSLGIAHLAGDRLTKKVREFINDEFRGGKSKWNMQCTEYVHYRVKSKLGIDIKWPTRIGRNGGKWADIFRRYKKYTILKKPEVNCAMCFTTGISNNPKINETGHVAFVEKVYPSGTIKISEANWPRNGIYNERNLSIAEWKNKYKAQFVKFQ